MRTKRFIENQHAKRKQHTDAPQHSLVPRSIEQHTMALHSALIAYVLSVIPPLLLVHTLSFFSKFDVGFASIKRDVRMRPEAQ